MYTSKNTRRRWLSGCAAAGLAVVVVHPRNVAADDAETTADRLKTLRACESLTAAFRYFGDQDKPFYQVTYHLGDFDAGAGSNPFNRATKLDREAMLKLLDALGKDGFIAAARDISTKDIKPAPGYSLTL